MSMIILANSILIVRSDGDEYTISGTIKTKDSRPMKDVRVDLLYRNHVVESDRTNNNGYYRIEEDDLRDNRVYSLRIINDRIQTQTINFEITRLKITIDVIVNQKPIANIVFPDKGYINEIITFSASRSYDPDDDPLEYYWSFGDGETSSRETVNHAYAYPGDYIVTLEVTDSDGASDKIQGKIKISNRAPVANIDGPYIGRKGSKIQFSSENSYDPDGDPLNYYWDFGDKTHSTEPNPQHIYNKAGIYDVKLTVTDTHGAKNRVTTTCQIVENIKPVAKANGHYSGYTGVPIIFSSKGSYDPDGSIQSYLWEFSDGRQVNTASPSIIFNETGDYKVTLTITDNEGEVSSDVATIKIQTPPNIPPVASCNGPYSGFTNQIITFSSSGSYDPDDDTLKYYWEFGDGETSQTENPEHRYKSPGTYVVILTVKDIDNKTSTSTTSSTITTRPSPPPPQKPAPTNQAPVAFGEIPETGVTHQSIQFTSDGSHDPDGTIEEYNWSFGDGETSKEKNPVHLYSEPGSYQVTLTVTDNEGKTDTYEKNIKIINPNIPPVIEVTSNITATTNELIQFTLLECYDPDGRIVQYFWDFGDNFTSSLENPEHSYTQSGVYNVTITVVDDSNTSSSRVSTLFIKDNLPPSPIIESLNISKVGHVIEFSAHPTYDEDREIIEYFWDFGDGTYSNEETKKHIYLEEGEKTVILTVTDNNNYETSVSKKILVTYNRPPEIHTKDKFTGTLGESILFVSESVDPDGEIVSTLWDFGDGTTGEGSFIYHSYDLPGIYFGRVLVTDDNSEPSLKNITINITEEPTKVKPPYLTISVITIITLGYIFRNLWQI